VALRRYNPHNMELKHLKTKISYTIEPNPAGGFIARSADPSIPSIEAPTMEELQNKIQTQLTATITSQFPGLNMPVAIAKAAAAWGNAISRTVTVNTSNGDSVISKAASPEEVKQFAKQFAGIVQKDFPELAQELSAKAERLVPSDSTQQDGVGPQTRLPIATFSNVNRGAFPKDAANRPILPEASSTWRFLGICAIMLALALAFLLYTHR